MVEEPRAWEKIRANRRRLTYEFKLDPVELLQQLGVNGVLTFREEKRMRTIEDSTRLNEEIFVTLFAKNPSRFYDLFLGALRDMRREDIVAFLQSNSYHTHGNIDNWERQSPAAEKDRKKRRTNKTVT